MNESINQPINQRINQLKPVFLKTITYFNSNRKIPPVSRPTHPQHCQPKAEPKK